MRLHQHEDTKARSIPLLILLLFFSLTGLLYGQTTFRADMNASQTTYGSTSSATGTCTVTLNREHTEIEIACNHTVSSPTQAHVHNAPPGQAGPVVFGLGMGRSPIQEVWQEPQQTAVNALLAEDLYVNIHSEEYPQGEIRGQLFQIVSDQPFDSELYFAQVGNGGGLRSEMVLLNPFAGKSVSGEIRFFDPLGMPLGLGLEGQEIQSAVAFEIAPLDALTIATDGQGANARAGSAVVLSDDTLGGVIRFEIAGIGIAGVGHSAPESKALIPVRRIIHGVRTGVAVRNNSESTILVRYSLREGGLLIEEKPIEIPAAGRHSQFVDEIFELSSETNFSGTLQLECLQGCTFSAIALELDSENGKFTTLPVTPFLETN